uniref:septum site-determining protein n=1 Tax=Phyllosiphon coccidium TaxID=1837062 RepID=UPI0024119429|nr:septum site-determining protein [Phyllosiphon coccidium]WDY12732.1 septum site-determining protein [Phyllosiphon coccidium]
MSAKNLFLRKAKVSLPAWAVSNPCHILNQLSAAPLFSGKRSYQTLPRSADKRCSTKTPGVSNTTPLLLYNQRGSPYKRVWGESVYLPKSFRKTCFNRLSPIKFCSSQSAQSVARRFSGCVVHATSLGRGLIDENKLLTQREESAIVPLPANRKKSRCTLAKQTVATPLCFLQNPAHVENRKRSLACLSSVSTTPQPQTEQDQASRTIVITSGKGGVGKTTTTANLGMSIARLGYRVALIDADIGLRNLDLLLGLENRVLYTAMDIFEGECRLDQALIRDKRLKNLCLLAISKNRQRYNVTRQKMDHLVSSISSLGYHFVLIDCPAGIDVGFINAISPAQEALIVTTPEITAMRDADRVAGLLEANGIYNAKLLINRVRPDMIQRHDMMSVQDVQDVLGIPLLGAIPEDIDVIISTNRGEPLVLRKKLTLSGIAFENAARRLIGKQDYLIDLKTPYKGIFQKIQTLFFNN